MREEQGGVYDIHVSGNASLHPTPRYTLEFSWGCSPENVEKLVATVFEEVKKIKTNGATETDLKKVKETLIRERETAMKDNLFWQQVLLNTYRQGDKLMSLEEYVKMVNAVKTNDIRRVARQYFNETNYTLGKLMPMNE